MIVHNRPIQPINDLKILKVSAYFARPIYSKAIYHICDSFSNQNNVNIPSIIVAPNKSNDRIEKKIQESDIGGYNKILDYVRGTVVFKTLEDLFDFVNFARKYDFSNLSLNDVDSKNLKILEYGVNSLSLDKKSLTDKNIQKYPFLKEKVKLRSSEYMDYKLYIKVPVKSFSDVKDSYMVAEILCILEDFFNFYDFTHYLYEENRINTNNTEDIKGLQNVVGVKKFSNEILPAFKKYLTYYTHRHYVVEEYNKIPEHKMKLIRMNKTKERDTNNFFASLTDDMKPYIIKSVLVPIVDKSADSGKTFIMMQTMEIFIEVLEKFGNKSVNTDMQIKKILQDTLGR